MTELLTANSYWGIFLTLGAFFLSQLLQQKTKSPLLNPILLGSVLVMLFLGLTGISVDTYQASCAPLQLLLTPATICFAIGLYEQLEKLKRHLLAILAGILSGTVISLGSVRLLCGLFGMDAVLRASLLPKSITTAIGIVLSQEAGGIAAITTAAIVLTGILGNMFGPLLCRLFRFTDPIAQGVAFGTASHAVGTSRASELSELAGAVSSLSLTAAGLVTTVLFDLFLNL